MPAKLIKYKDEKIAVVYVRVPGWLKNLISEAAESRKTSVNNWCANILKSAAETGTGLPEPPKSHGPVPSAQDVVRDYLSGEKGKLLEPCGKQAPCERRAAGTHRVGDFEYCNHCRVRIG
jgi:hypothetical protein